MAASNSYLLHGWTCIKSKTVIPLTQTVKYTEMGSVKGGKKNQRETSHKLKHEKVEQKKCVWDIKV